MNVLDTEVTEVTAIKSFLRDAKMNEKEIKKIKVRQDLQSEFEGTINQRKAIFRI